MTVEIIEEAVSALPEYEKVPIAFRVESQFIVVPGENRLGRVELIEQPVVPYVKDYDANENERPTSWPRRFDISRWGIISAFKRTQRIGGAAVAWQTPELDMLEGRNDLVCLWDLRVHPDFRDQGIGHQLFSRAVGWARERSCHRFKVETQNVNVPACRFYARQGCELEAINRCAYEGLPDEVQLLWYRDV